MSEHRSRLFAVASRLIALNPADRRAQEALAGICEALYRCSASYPSLMAELESWLKTKRGRSAVVDSWLALTRLAQRSQGDSAEGELKILDASLSQVAGRAGLVLRTEAAQLLWRIEGNPARAWERLRGEPSPDPGFGEAASEAAVVWLRLAAMAADWESHARLAEEFQARWANPETPAAGWISITVAEHEVQRGFFAIALGRLKPLASHANPWVRLAALEVTLRTLLDCDSDAASERLKAELKRTACFLEPLLELETPVGGFPSPDEWKERRRISRLLLDHVFEDRRSVVEVNSSVLTQALALEREGNKPGALALVGEALERPAGWELPEESLRLRLLLVRLTLELAPDLTPAEAASCEDLVSSVLIEAQARNLLFVEMLASDQRALIRGRLFEDRWEETIADAGFAANLAAQVLEANRGSFFERSLRASLLPILDRAVELLAEGSLRAAEREPEDVPGHARYGRAILDYVEQSMALALAEARARISSEGEAKALPLGTPPALAQPKRCETLQAVLPARDGVLQYFLVGNFLLVFAFGRSFFVWHVEALKDTYPADGVPIRKFLQAFLPGGRAGSDILPIPYTRDLAVNHGAILPAGPGEDLARLAPYLLPTPVMEVLKRHRVRRLAIVPHDVLYRAPFGRLSWRGVRLAQRFGLSIHPTGAAAVFRSVAPERQDRCRVKVGFFVGPGLRYAREEWQELRSAFGWAAEVEEIDTSSQDDCFSRKAKDFEVLYLACHGSGPKDDPKQAALLLGKPGHLVTLPEISSLDLKRCRLAVLQACWTGWIDHVREFPAQGFPQTILDAGAAAVVAPMLPVNDALCPIFTSVFCRVLRFRAAGEALGYTLEVLRGRGKSLALTDPHAASTWAKGWTFDSYEYRFAGDPAVDLSGGWLHRVFARVAFQIWLWKRILDSRRASQKNFSPASARPSS